MGTETNFSTGGNTIDLVDDTSLPEFYWYKMGRLYLGGVTEPSLQLLSFKYPMVPMK